MTQASHTGARPRAHRRMNSGSERLRNRVGLTVIALVMSACVPDDPEADPGFALSENEVFVCI